MELLNGQIVKLLNEAGVSGEIELSAPPKPEMGDLAFACFEVAKKAGKNPVEMAKEIVERLNASLVETRLIASVQSFGPYVNFYLNGVELAKLVLESSKSPSVKTQGKQKVMVEFAHPNTHKPVHIGHLRNMVTGESMVRILENSGHKVVRANYQGDVGMHIAKCLWGMFQNENLKIKMKNLRTVGDRAKFLGKVYAVGGQAYESDEKAKKEIEEMNGKIYKQDKEIWKLYKITRQWSLDYFDYVYKRVGIKKFDRLYFESETFKPGIAIVQAGLKKGIFKESQGAIIFEGSKFGLHDRVFINSKGFPTYEAKDLALAEKQFKEYKPERIIHLVAKEQSEYFRVMFKALEFTFPKSIGNEKHLVYGWVSLKDGKMSSRTGNVVLAEWLLDEVEKRIEDIMKDREIKNKKDAVKKIANAAVKYSMLKTGIDNDIVFDINESISTTGDSGPYLQYIVARINSVIKKSKKLKINKSKKIMPEKIEPAEKHLLLSLTKFAEVTSEVGEKMDPSVIAKYLFDLAQAFNSFYHDCPVLQTDPQECALRLKIIKAVKDVMEKGLYLLGIEEVKEM